MRQLSSELLILPPLRCGENQEFETDAPPGHGSTAALGYFWSDKEVMGMR